MEKILMGLGFGIVCVSFFLSMGIGTQFLWGCVAGLLPLGIGWHYSE